MSLFTISQKKYALKKNSADLQKEYHESEINLHNAVIEKDNAKFRKEMKKHKRCEYALLFKNTDEYKKKVRKQKHGRF